MKLLKPKTGFQQPKTGLPNKPVLTSLPITDYCQPQAHLFSTPFILST